MKAVLLQFLSVMVPILQYLSISEKLILQMSNSYSSICRSQEKYQAHEQQLLQHYYKEDQKIKFNNYYKYLINSTKKWRHKIYSIPRSTLLILSLIKKETRRIDITVNADFVLLESYEEAESGVTLEYLKPLHFEQKKT